MIDWLKSIPLFWGNVLSVLGFVAIIAWVWIRPKSFIFQGAPDRKWWRDLRIWATVALSIQILIYIVI